MGGLPTAAAAARPSGAGLVVGGPICLFVCGGLALRGPWRRRASRSPVRGSGRYFAIRVVCRGFMYGRGAVGADPWHSAGVA